MKGGEDKIPTKFQVNLENLNFYESYALCSIVYLYGPEIYRTYRTKLYGPVMIKLYKKNYIILEIMGKS